MYPSRCCELESPFDRRACRLLACQLFDQPSMNSTGIGMDARRDSLLYDIPCNVDGLEKMKRRSFS